MRGMATPNDYCKIRRVEKKLKKKEKNLINDQYKPEPIFNQNESIIIGGGSYKNPIRLDTPFDEWSNCQNRPPNYAKRTGSNEGSARH